MGMMVHLLWKTVWQFLKNLEIELQYDLAFPLLCIYPKELKAVLQRCISMFIALLFAIAKRWKQPKCPSADKWVNTIWYIQTMEYYSALKRKEILTHACNMDDTSGIMLS